MIEPKGPTSSHDHGDLADIDEKDPDCASTRYPEAFLVSLLNVLASGCPSDIPQ
jgi:hypothetical protein